MARVAVVGGGITGLSCAYYLREAGHEPIVYEATNRVGGKIRTVSHSGSDSPYKDIPVEGGADSFLPRDDLPIELCRALGLGDDLISPAVFGAYIYFGGRMRKLPSGFSYGIPVDPWAARSAGLLSVSGALRAYRDLFALRALSGPDISLGEFVRARFGDETATNLVAPLLVGTRAGTIDDISLAAGAKEIDTIARSDRSVIRGLRRSSTEIGAGSGSFVSIRGGLDRLTNALAEALPAVETESRVNELGDLAADFYVLAIPAFAAARLVASLNAEAARGLAAIPYDSGLSITLFYAPGAADLPADGSGVLIRPGEGLAMTACTWYSQKWPESRPSDGGTVIRAFVGGPGMRLPPYMEEEELEMQVEGELQYVLGLKTDEPEAAIGVRWEDSLPVYQVGHLDRIAAIEAALPRNVVLAGAAYRGSGIPDCIHDARRAAQIITTRSEQGGR